jgi:hypothetical protein
LKSGRGTYYLKNKEVIEGSWLKGKQFGQFYHTDENHERIKKDWSDEKYKKYICPQERRG